MTLTPDTLRHLVSQRDPLTRPADGRIVAAVLVPLLWRSEEPALVLTRRTETVQHHRGQISFPGGRREPGDRDAVHTALRECEEEIGLSSEDVDVIGRLDDYLTRTSLYHLTPIVGVITRPPATWRLQASEVSEVLEVPLSHLSDPANRGEHSVEKDHHTITTPAFRWSGHTVWGATADILSDLLDLIANTP